MEKILLGVALWASLFLSACGPDYLYQEQKRIPNGEWTYGDTLDFRFSVKDTSQLYHLYLDIEYADSFPTQNVYLKLYTLFPDGKRMSKQKSYDFFNTQGEPTGSCSGQHCRLRATLQENAYFNRPGEYVITLEQFTRQDSLPGIVSVGLAVERTAQKVGDQKSKPGKERKG